MKRHAICLTDRIVWLSVAGAAFGDVGASLFVARLALEGECFGRRTRWKETGLEGEGERTSRRTHWKENALDARGTHWKENALQGERIGRRTHWKEKGLEGEGIGRRTGWKEKATWPSLHCTMTKILDDTIIPIISHNI